MNGDAAPPAKLVSTTCARKAMPVTPPLKGVRRDVFVGPITTLADGYGRMSEHLAANGVDIAQAPLTLGALLAIASTA